MWVNLSLHNIERATTHINRIKSYKSYKKKKLFTPSLRDKLRSVANQSILRGVSGMHHPQFVMLISWVRCTWRISPLPPPASRSESVSQLNLPFDLAGRRACGRAAPRSKSTWFTRCFDTSRRILMIPVLPEQEIGQTRTAACLCVAPRKVSINLLHYIDSLMKLEIP